MKMIVIGAGDKHTTTSAAVKSCVGRLLEGKKPSDVPWGFFSSLQAHSLRTLDKVKAGLAKSDPLFSARISKIEVDSMHVTKKAHVAYFSGNIRGRRVLDHNAVNLIVVPPDLVKHLIKALLDSDKKYVGQIKPLNGYMILPGGHVCSFG